MEVLPGLEGNAIRIGIASHVPPRHWPSSERTGHFTSRILIETLLNIEDEHASPVRRSRNRQSLNFCVGMCEKIGQITAGFPFRSRKRAAFRSRDELRQYLSYLAASGLRADAIHSAPTALRRIVGTCDPKQIRFFLFPLSPVLRKAVDACRMPREGENAAFGRSFFPARPSVRALNAAGTWKDISSRVLMRLRGFVRA